MQENQQVIAQNQQLLATQGNKIALSLEMLTKQIKELDNDLFEDNSQSESEALPHFQSENKTP